MNLFKFELASETQDILQKKYVDYIEYQIFDAISCLTKCEMSLSVGKDMTDECLHSIKDLIFKIQEVPKIPAILEIVYMCLKTSKGGYRRQILQAINFELKSMFADINRSGTRLNMITNAYLNKNWQMLKLDIIQKLNTHLHLEMINFDRERVM